MSLCLSCIFIEASEAKKRTLQQAEKIAKTYIDALHSNKIDFPTLALTRSDDEITRRKCGRLGYVTRSFPVAGFYENGLSMPLGGISDEPYPVENGYYIFWREE
eukprot:gnl/Carplike_NY0171/2634_a3540_452.p1 GENE.gnl/Carplike_NY0171/2634_a3540_452~~gnl/Carplike_NY0171/2634_a3540_452.p1  ORF type:complete len:104 (+),score=8.38 gnl/Carplike_NY0171/2634_a3540_452:50-361(+)